MGTSNDGVIGLGIRISHLRKERRWSIFELEKRTGLSRSHIHSLELGKVKNPDSLTIIKLAKGLEVSIDALLDFHPQVKERCSACAGEGWVYIDVEVA